MENMAILMLLKGLALLGAGIACILYVGRRAFRRRNSYGVEEFSSFGSKILSILLETGLSLLGFVLGVMAIMPLMMGFMGLFK